ncbi:MAG: hypothetical protein IPG78_09390 [Ignavibacteria bacterium]|nr:hypothetical protein [Ignavibacteria bacterium]
MKKIVFCLTAMLIFSGAVNLFSQELIIYDKDVPAVTIENENLNQHRTQKNIQTNEELNIIDEMNRLKADQNQLNGDKILQLQKKLESINHRSVTIESDNSSPKLFSDEAIRNHLQNQNDAIIKSELFSMPSAYIKSIATQTEHYIAGGVPTGTIWVAVAIGGGDAGVGASPDTLLMFKSVDNGSTYSLYSRLPLNVGNKINYDDMDMEFVHANPTHKYLHVVLGYITDGFTGAYRTGIISYDIVNNTVGGGSPLTFPGFTYTGNKYSGARIVSDNAYYHSAYVTIAVTQDSTDGVNNYYMTKYCRIFSPYSINPAITYMPNSIYVPFPGFSTTAQTDIAFYNNGIDSGSDSVIFVVSGIPGFINLILTYKAQWNTMTNPVLSTILFQNFNNKESAKIASSGGNNQQKMMIVYIEENIGVSVFKSSDATNWSNSLILGGGGSLFQFKSPDIMGRRGGNGKFYITSKAETPMTDVITSYVFDNLNLISSTINHNNLNYKSYSAPKPSLRFMNNDSCLTFWPAYSSVYSSCGCNAINVAFRAYIQGLYDPVNNTPKYDYSTLYLRQTIPPYAKVDSAFGYNATLFSFHNASPGLYYISMNHRNSIETWYKQPHNFVSPGTNTLILFQNAANAYGSNQVQVDDTPLTFAIYSGDVNQDGTIDASDLSDTDNDSFVGLSGYVNTDVTGDDFVDAADVSIVDNNAFNAVSVVRP